MKTWIFSMYMGVFCLISAPCIAQSFSFKISGKLTNISPMPTKLYLKSMVSGMLQKDSDSTPVINGQYLFRGELNVDEAVLVLISPKQKMDKNNVFTVFIDKGELDVVSEGTLGNFTVTGSAATAQHEYDDIKNGVEKEKAELQRITSTDEYKINQQMQADVLKRSRAVAGKGITDTYLFLKNNPDKRSAPFDTWMLTVGLPVINGKALDSILAALPEHVKKDRLGQEIIHAPARRDSLNKFAQAMKKVDAGKVQVGAQAPDFTQPDVNNKTISLSSFKGKYVLVDFWASWCAPCRAENPNVVKAYNKYKDKGFTVLGVSLDAQASRNAWIKAIASDGLKWTEVADLKGWKNEAAVAYGVSSIPQNFLIDPNGVVIAKDLRGDELNAKLASLFK